MYSASVFIHILAAAVWVGGLAFFALVVVPLVRRMPPADAAPLIRMVGERFRLVGGVSLACLVLSGVANLLLRWASPADLVSAAFWSSRFGTLLGVKLSLVVGIVVITLAHDRSGQLSTTAPHDDARRRRASRNGRITALLSLAVVLLGVLLTH